MAALDTPWVDSMSPQTPIPQNDGASGLAVANEPATVAAFSPANISGTSLTSKQRSTVIVHRKSPLLVATPPAVTRALAYSHPFLLPLNRLAGLITWTSGDPWQSFLLVAGFWAITLYGDVLMLRAGPIMVVVGLMLGMYSRRYSPLSSTGLTGEKHGHRRGESESSSSQSKTLDEIVEALRTFTERCNIMLEPLLELTDFLSTQRTATSATTRPALTALLTRILLVTPIWILLTLRPFYLLTTRRVVVVVGTIILTWHSKAARISRVILWRSMTVRRICSMIIGLEFSSMSSPNEKPSLKSTSSASRHSLRPFRTKSNKDERATDISTKKRRSDSSGIRFTFILYENQRRWLGIGWTYSLLAYERSPWTDEHLNPAPSKDDFELPEVQDGNSKWRWVPGSEWKVDGAIPDSSPKKSEKNNKNDKAKEANDAGWIYYDNKWNDGRRGQDGWGRYTRRRKWCRDAELVEVTSSTETTPLSSPPVDKVSSELSAADGKVSSGNGVATGSDGKDAQKVRKRRWFGSAENTARPPSSSPPPPPPTITTSSLPNLDAGSLSTSMAGDTTSGKANSISSARSSRSAPYLEPTRALSFDGVGNGDRNSQSNNNTNTNTNSGRSSVRGRRGSKASSSTTEVDRKSMTRSLREKEIETAEDTVDQWGGRPGGVAERSVRGWGLGDDAHMGLS